MIMFNAARFTRRVTVQTSLGGRTRQYLRRFGHEPVALFDITWRTGNTTSFILPRGPVIPVLVGMGRREDCRVRPRRHDRQDLTAADQPESFHQLGRRRSESTPWNRRDTTVV